MHGCKVVVFQSQSSSLQAEQHCSCAHNLTPCVRIWNDQAKSIPGSGNSVYCRQQPCTGRSLNALARSSRYASACMQERCIDLQLSAPISSHVKQAPDHKAHASTPSPMTAPQQLRLFPPAKAARSHHTKPLSFHGSAPPAQNSCTAKQRLGSRLTAWRPWRAAVQRGCCWGLHACACSRLHKTIEDTGHETQV